MEILEEKSVQEIAETLYELSIDMDYMDYEDEKDQILQDLENALYHIKSIAQNKYNNDYFRTFYNILQKI